MSCRLLPSDAPMKIGSLVLRAQSQWVVGSLAVRRHCEDDINALCSDISRFLSVIELPGGGAPILLPYRIETNHCTTITHIEIEGEQNKKKSCCCVHSAI